MERKRNLERIQKDVRFFEQQLKSERNQFLRNIILGQIRDLKQQHFNILRKERHQAQREYKNLKDALDEALALQAIKNQKK